MKSRLLLSWYAYSSTGNVSHQNHKPQAYTTSTTVETHGKLAGMPMNYSYNPNPNPTALTLIA